MRVTNRMMVQSATADLGRRLEKLDKARETISSGRTINRASDDPSGAGRVLSLRSTQVKREQEERNAADAAQKLDLADSSLQSMGSRLRRVRDLVVSGANTTGSAQSRTAIAQEVASIREELLSVANARHDGRPLFAGFADVDAVVRAPGGWIYQGDDGVVTRRIGDNDTIGVNVTGDDVFGFTGAQDTFTLLDNIEAHLMADDQTALSADIAAVDEASQRILSSLGQIGAARNRTDSALVRNSDAIVALRGELSSIEDASLSEAVMELQMQEMSYQATLGALARAMPPSLASFLS